MQGFVPYIGGLQETSQSFVPCHTFYHVGTPCLPPPDDRKQGFILETEWPSPYIQFTTHSSWTLQSIYRTVGEKFLLFINYLIGSILDTEIVVVGGPKSWPLAWLPRAQVQAWCIWKPPGYKKSGIVIIHIKDSNYWYSGRKFYW